jgi:hypothetical protein
VGANFRISEYLVPQWLEHQKAKAADYNTPASALDPLAGFENADVLGIPGQFAEIWRKVWKLKRGMWDGATLVNEGVREILLDMIGHCFLAIDMLDRLKGEEFARSGYKMATTDWGDPAQQALPSDLGNSPTCGTHCMPKRHTFHGECRYRLAESQE